MQLSYWEKNTFFSNIDIGIVGGGLIGMCTALYLKQALPQCNITIFERGTLPYGASTRNAGFACIGSLGELLDDHKHESIESILQRISLRYEGLKGLRALVGDTPMDYKSYGGFEIFTKENSDEYHLCEVSIEKWNHYLSPITGLKDTFVAADEDIERFGFSNVDHIIMNKAEGQIDTGKLIDALIRQCNSNGVRILNGIAITKIIQEGGSATLRSDKIDIPCRKVVLCNNAFARQFLPEIDVIPARAQVLVTTPIDNLRLRGSFHYQQGYYYFRNINNRILLGGGRNIDKIGETTYEFGTTDVIMDGLRQLLNDIILPNIPYDIAQSWSGIMAMGNSKTPIITKIDNSLYVAVRMGGMGIAIGSTVAKTVSNMIVEDMN